MTKQPRQAPSTASHTNIGRNEAFFETALDAIIIIDQHGLISDFNPSAERIFGYTRSQAIGREMALLIIPERYHEMHRNGMARYLATDKGPLMNKLLEVSAVRSNGQEFPVELTITRIKSEGPPSFMGTLRDITERKQSEEDSRRRRELEYETAKLIEVSRAKDAFIALASHQLRTPATGVKQYIGMLMHGYFGELDEAQIAALQTAYDSNERQLYIINSLLNVAQIDADNIELSLTPQRIDLMISDIISEQHDIIDSRHQAITTDLGPVTVAIDARLIRMVLENLIDNASKYTPHHKSIGISLTATPKTVSIAIKDHGVGIAKRDLQKLFHKFSRIDNPLSTSANGSGLGLYWAKRVVGLHGGDITVSSKLRQGSTFTVVLPRKRPA